MSFKFTPGSAASLKSNTDTPELTFSEGRVNKRVVLSLGITRRQSFHEVPVLLGHAEKLGRHLGNKSDVFVGQYMRRLTEPHCFS